MRANPPPDPSEPPCYMSHSHPLGRGGWGKLFPVEAEEKGACNQAYTELTIH